MAYSRNNEKLFWEEETHLNPHRNLNSLISKKKKKKHDRVWRESERCKGIHLGFEFDSLTTSETTMTNHSIFSSLI